MKSFVSLIHKTRQRFAGLTDTRRGKNTHYSMEDFATSAFSVFFTQSASFLAYQKTMQQTKGRSNLGTRPAFAKVALLTSGIDRGKTAAKRRQSMSHRG